MKFEIMFDNSEKNGNLEELLGGKISEKIGIKIIKLIEEKMSRNKRNEISI